MANDTRFKPGQSGNPSGRPKMPEELLTRLRDISTKTIDVYEGCLTSTDEKVRLMACRDINDRAWGKPSQESDVTLRGEELSPGQAHLAALLAMAERRKVSRKDDDTNLADA
jgi:hypothetical protein